MPDDKKLTDADIMTGFNPAFGVSAEDIEAQGATGDEAVSQDGEGEGSEETPQAPTERELNLDGRTFKAPAELAEAFTREINRRDGTRGAELQQLRERLARLEGASTTTAQPAKKDEGPPLPDPELQIENPAEYQAQLMAHVEHKQRLHTEALAREYEEAEAARERETARQAAWKNHVEAFYSDPANKVLVGNEDIVDAVMAQNAEKLAPLSVEEGFKLLGQLSRERLARLTGAAPDVKARTTPKPPTLEGSSRRDVAAGTQGGAKDTGPKSLTQALRERRKQAAASFSKGGQGHPAVAR